jgi:aryl-phospho-beta-D-glucosidase BglC (GH1 family)
MGTDYIYPSANEINYYASKGMTVIRVPFQLERLEPSPGAPLDQTQVIALQQVISEAAADGVDVVLDPHNYGYAWGNLIGGGTSNSQFADFWGEMASAFKGDSNVIFGLMNEPNVQSPSGWTQSDNAAIAAIRQAGANQEILVPGSDWTGAWSWLSSGNAAAINPSTIHDPDNNWAIEVHQYLDSNGSGTNYSPITDPNIGVERLTDITNWAQQNGVKLFLGETGVPGDSQSLTALQNMLSYMEQNANVWQGAAYWAGGPWWGSYPMSIEPSGLGTGNVTDAPQMSVLTQFTHGDPQPAQAASASGDSTSSNPGSGTNSGSSAGGSTAAPSSTITVPSDSANYTTNVSNTTINTSTGNQILFIGGSNDTITATGGNNTITASAGNNTITTDRGNNTLIYGGSNNQITAGPGANTLNDNSSNSTIVLPRAGQGSDTINGNIFANGDTLDLRPLLAGTQWNGDTSTLGSFLNTSLNGSDAILSVDPTGSGASGTQVADFVGSGSIDLSTLLNHALT